METMEFDATLGGNEHLPYAANSLKFTASRSIEIAAMTESILRPSKTKLIFQSLPVHMRRRVMSHNSKRLPRKLRQAHMDQLKKSGLPPKQKRPSRKYRRRPANLLEEYNRRKKRNVWLETHIWHAKRFHMTQRWGHRLAYAPCDKAFRACYRGSSVHSLLQDISYYTPVLITGMLDAIKEVFSNISDSSCGLGICAKAYTNGNREGFIHLYEENQFPYGYIGKVQFLWEQCGESLKKKIWLFIHPSQIKQVESLFDNILGNKVEDYETAVKRIKLDNNVNTKNVEFKVMSGSFNRFRLTGPNSHAILVQTLKCISDSNRIKNDEWLTLHPPKHLKEKAEYWDSLKMASSPAQLPPNIVIGLVVKDPRLSRPSYRTKAKRNMDVELTRDSLSTVPTFLGNSPIWNTEIHYVLKSKMLTNGQFIAHITKTQLVPGHVNEDDPALQSVPVVLIQRPGSQRPEFKKLGYGSGWDIIIPSGYGLSFWLTFIMFGARSGGLRETENVAFEMAECYLPPDCDAGKQEEKRIEMELRDRYFRLPPSKRVNYIKLGINSPFNCPWKLLLSDWAKETVNDFFVLRDMNLLCNIEECITKKLCLQNINNSSACLIPVYIKLAAKGSLKRNALICLPERGDIANIKTVMEPQHEDPNEKNRKLRRSEHLKEIKRLRKKRLRLRKKSRKVTAKKSVKLIKGPSEYVKTMRELWLPNIKSVRNVASRQTIGYISQAAFSFTEACTCGIGYVTYNSLNSLLKSGMNQVLVRNKTSKKYRLANIHVINNV